MGAAREGCSPLLARAVAMAELSDHGRLSDAENERIFRTEILPDYLQAETSRSDRPVLVILGGQPGAGKTALLTSSQTELEGQGPTIRIVGDDLRSYHPAFSSLQAADPERASRHTQLDAGRWTEKLLAVATERGVNVVFETTMRTPDNVARVVEKGREAGYRVEARIVAVNPRVSWQGCLYRFEEMHHAGEAARIPPRTVHDAAVAGLAASLDRIERDQLADRVVIRLRSGATVYDNEVADGRWRATLEAVSRLENARNLVMSRQESETFAATWLKVIARMEARGARAELVDEARALSKQDLAWLAVERRKTDQGDDEKRARSMKPKIGEGPAIRRAMAEDERQDRGREERRRPPPSARASDADVLIPGRNLPDLGAAEIGDALSRSVRLAEKRAEIERLSVLVYGSATAVSPSLQNIDRAAAGSVAADDVRTGKLGPLAGEGRRFLRAESPERQAAKAHLPQLAAAMEDYGRSVDFERHRVETTHREEQFRQRQEVRRPSEALATVLDVPAHEQASRLAASPDLRRELDRISTSINRRLNVDERKALSIGNAAELSRSLAVSRSQADNLIKVHAQTQAAQQLNHALRQSQARARTDGIGLKR